MTLAKIIRNGNSQGIHIPQEMRTTDKEFYIAKMGNAYIAWPADDPWMPAWQINASGGDFFQGGSFFLNHRGSFCKNMNPFRHTMHIL